ncbi:Phosphatidylinositol-glycan biosynthesis class X protein [Camellia lanceoleosa]|uniref:Phosphatidylinositol-glycan biosynthesis class X protein n=1 Tax=Camellia lanceoleosa TaxID=1840588 RepID=A0ACC0G3V9_9ERIC|nr:Phosphatidylinositol-glycan biosynthesis class X protein [Camellia lanceoleosa]
MEVQKHQVQIFMLVGIQLIFLTSIGLCMHTCFVSSEGGKCNSNSDAKTQNGLPNLKKYITEPYFEKHDSLLDSDFQNFIANNLPLGLFCVSVLKRHLIGEGALRCLSSSIRLSIQPESIAELPRHFCKIIIVERLPSGIFADPFELQHLLQHGVFTDAAVFGETNLELPIVVSNQSVVEVHVEVDLTYSYSATLKDPFILCNIEGTHSYSATLKDLFILCNIEGKSQLDSCLFTQTGSNSKSQAVVVWEIPCGIKERSGVVSVVTFISAIVSAILIVLASIYYSDTQTFAVI